MTKRGYHADLGGGNTARQVHYLLEPVWRTDLALEGFLERPQDRELFGLEPRPDPGLQ